MFEDSPDYQNLTPTYDDDGSAMPASAPLGKGPLRVYERMLFYEQGSAGVTVSQKRLAEDLRVPNPETGGRVQVGRWIKQLVAARWVVVEDERDSRRGRRGAGELESTNRYRLTGPDSTGRQPRRAQRVGRPSAKPQVAPREHPVDNAKPQVAPREQVSGVKEEPQVTGQNRRSLRGNTENRRSLRGNTPPTVTSESDFEAAKPQVAPREHPVDNSPKYSLREGKPRPGSEDGVLQPEPLSGARTREGRGGALTDERVGEHMATCRRMIELGGADEPEPVDPGDDIPADIRSDLAREDTHRAIRRYRQGGILTSVTIPDDGWPEEPPEPVDLEDDDHEPDATPFDDLDPDLAEALTALEAAGLEAASVEVYENDDPRLARRRRRTGDGGAAWQAQWSTPVPVRGRPA